MTELFREPARSWDVLEQQRERLDDRVATMSEAELTGRPVDAIADELCERYSLNVPVLDEQHAVAAREEILLDPAHGQPRRFLAGHQVRTRGLRITVSVPFSGDRRILDLRPDTYESIAPQGEVGPTAVVFVAEGAKLDADLVRADYEAWLSLVRRNLELHRARLGTFNETLRSNVLASLGERLATLREHQEIVTRLGLPIAA